MPIMVKYKHIKNHNKFFPFRISNLQVWRLCWCIDSLSSYIKFSLEDNKEQSMIRKEEMPNHHQLSKIGLNIVKEWKVHWFNEANYNEYFDSPIKKCIIHKEAEWLNHAD